MAGPAPVKRRAPRLGPQDRLGRHFTRTGRFAKIDPSKGRKLPAPSRVIASLGWALLVEESLRRAYRRVRSPAEPGGDGG